MSTPSLPLAACPAPGPANRPISASQTLLLAAVLLALAAALRLWHLDAGWFGVDQARDATWAERIASGTAWPVAGPQMRNRVRLGATYYFFWALPALVADSPLAGYAFAAVLGTAAVAGAGLLAHRIAGPAAGLVAMLWLAAHPVAVIHSRIAWAPAAVPAICALLLLVGRRFLREPRLGSATLLGGVAALATQVHLAAAALLPVAAGTLLARLGRVGRAGLAAAALGAGAVLWPMGLAVLQSVPVAPAATDVAVSPYAYRAIDFLFLVPRVLSGLTPAYAALPAAVRVWIPLEFGAILLPLGAAAWLASRTAGMREPATLRLVLAAFVATILVPLLLPIEVWAYYLDARMVCGAVAVGVAASRLDRRWSIGLLVFAVGRTALLAWWVAGAAKQGSIPANLDYLRIGGARPAEPSARAPLLTVAARRRLADVLVDTIGDVERPLRWYVHGPGANNLDNDNGYFILREARERGRPKSTGLEALLVPPGRVPASWIDGFAEPTRVNGIDAYAYPGTLHTRDGWLEGCASGGLPPPPVPAPLDYGNGEPRQTAWPCSDPVVAIPFGAPPRGVVVRAFPILVGQGSVEILSVDPSGETFLSGVGFLGRGVILPESTGTLRLRLHLDGPATLDLVELHGLRGDDPSGSRAEPRGGSPAAPTSPAGDLVRAAVRSSRAGEG